MNASKQLDQKWKFASLSDTLLEARSGFASGDDLEVGVFQIRMNNITTEGSLNLAKRRRVPLDFLKNDSLLLNPGDVLFNTTNSPDLVGKSAYIKALDEPTTFSNHFLRLRSKPSVIDGRFLSKWLQLHFSNGRFKGMCRQWVNQATVSRDSLLSLEIPVPPLSEQRRIAAILDKAEVLRAKRRAALAKLDTLAQSIFLDMFGDPFRNTKKLDCVSLGNLGKWQSGGTPARSNTDYFGGEIPWFSSGELNSLYVLDSAEKITVRAIKESSVKRVPKGALMLGMYDTAALKSSFAGVDCSCNQAIAFSELNEEKCHPLYVYFAILVGKDGYKSLQRGVRQKNLNLSMIQEISIPNPSLEHQRIFARRIEAIEALTESHRASLAKLDALFASLQHRAFRGEL